MRPPGGVLHVAAGQQDLGHRVVVLGKELVICIHQLALAHGGGRLLPRHVRRTLRKPQLPHPHGNGAGGDQHDLVSGVFQIAEHLHQRFHMADVQMSRGIGYVGCSELDYNCHIVLSVLM